MSKIAQDRFYSILGSERPENLDVLWASRWAIDELIAMTEQGFLASQVVKRELQRVETVTLPHEKGRALESLMREMFQSVPGFKIRECNATTETEEIDLVIDNRSTDPLWAREQAIVLVECKNWSKPVGKNEVLSFQNKIVNRRGRCTVGIFVAWGGFADTVEKELLRTSRENWSMALIDGSSIRKAAESATFVRLLEEKWYEAIMR